MQEQNNNTKSKPESNFTDSLSFRDIMDLARKKWRWFVLSLVLCCSAAGLYIFITPPVYHREATILVKDARKGGGASELAAFSDIAGIATRRNVDNEVYVLQARRLMVEVVERLGLTVSYSERSGLRKIDLYEKTPAHLRFVEDDGTTGEFEMTAGEEKVSISGLCGWNGDIIYGDTVDVPCGRLVAVKSGNSEYFGRPIKVTKSDKESVATRYRSATKISVANKMSSIINLSLDDVSAKRAEDVLNTLIDVYNDDAVLDKQFISRETAEFITERIATLRQELETIDNEIKQFKSENNIIDLRTEAAATSEEVAYYTKAIAEAKTQLDTANDIKQQLSNKANNTTAIQEAISFSGNATAQQLNSMIQEYNSQLITRNRYARNGENNPIIADIDASLESMRKVILSSLEIHTSTLKIQLDNLEKEESRITSRIGTVPAKEKLYLALARQQKIKEEQLVYLLTKEEENNISLAVPERTARIVDPAWGPSAPVSPKKILIFIIAILLGLGLPLLYIYISQRFNTKVQGKQDITRYTSIPYLGDIPVFEGQTQRSIAVRENGRDKISEAFKILRTNMKFMNTGTKQQQVILVTSSNAHAGKTFVSINLGMTLAFSGNRVLMIDLDLRRRTLSKHMGQRSNPNGVTKYISSKDCAIEQIITNSKLHDNFDFIYAGLQPPNPAEMLMSERLDSLIAECRTRYDYIIIDSVPALIIADALIASRVSDLSIYVVREGLLDRRQLPDINALYTENKLQNMCIVLNGASETRHSYGYGYRYQYDPDFDGRTSVWRRILHKLNPFRKH